jgi:hypothetical protein
LNLIAERAKDTGSATKENLAPRILLTPEYHIGVRKGGERDKKKMEKMA